MFRYLASGAVIAAAVTGSALAAPLDAPAWAITPVDTACSTDLELVGRSGATVEVSLVSDGERMALRFTKDQLAAQSFLPIRIDQKPFSNLVLRSEDPNIAVMGLSDETVAALRKGAVLQIAWLADEIVSTSLSGSEQGLTDLRTCGAEVAAQYRSARAEKQAAEARALAEQRAKDVADEQLATARAQTAAAEAQRRRASAEAARLAAETDRQRALTDADQRRAADYRYSDQRYRYSDQRYQAQPQYSPPLPIWGYYRPYYSHE